MKQVNVQIMGQSYVLGCPIGEERQLHEAVELVDAAMRKIRDTNKVNSRDRIAVLASVSLVFDLMQPGAAIPAPATASAGDLNSVQDDARVTRLLQRLDQSLTGEGYSL
jgi:cell division protein ZapA